jgi:hypothetical protein
MRKKPWEKKLFHEKQEKKIPKPEYTGIINFSPDQIYKQYQEEINKQVEVIESAQKLMGVPIIFQPKEPSPYKGEIIEYKVLWDEPEKEKIKEEKKEVIDLGWGFE